MENAGLYLAQNCPDRPGILITGTIVHNPLRQLFSNILKHIMVIVFQYTRT